MAQLRSLIWYTILLIGLLVLYHFGKRYTAVIVEGDFRAMQPTLDSGTMYFIDRSRGTLTSLDRDSVIVFKTHERGETKRGFARVLATPGATVATRKNRLVVDGQDIAPAPPGVATLGTGMIVPRDTVLIGFDAVKAPRLPLSRLLIPCRNIIGRVIGK